MGWQTLPEGAQVWLYVPHSPKSVEKYGVKACTGPDPPAPDAPLAGTGLSPPSRKWPILQTYVDVCLTGCLEYGEDYAIEFIKTTFLWPAFWLNDRQVARRPWLYQKQYAYLDRLLKEHIPEYYTQRRLVDEYATHYMPDVDQRTILQEDTNAVNMGDSCEHVGEFD